MPLHTYHHLAGAHAPQYQSATEGTGAYAPPTRTSTGSRFPIRRGAYMSGKHSTYRSLRARCRRSVLPQGATAISTLMPARSCRTFGARLARPGSRGPYTYTHTLESPCVTCAEPSGRPVALADAGISEAPLAVCGESLNSIDRSSSGRRPSMRYPPALRSSMRDYHVSTRGGDTYHSTDSARRHTLSRTSATC